MGNLETLCKKLLVQGEVISSKMDTCLINQGKMKRSMIPNEKKSDKPNNMPPLPLDNVDQLSSMEKYLDDGENFTGVVSFFIEVFLYFQ